MRIFKQILEPKHGYGRVEVVLESKDMNEIVITDDDDNEFHISSDGYGVEIRCPEGILHISPNSSNKITVTSIPF